VDFFSFSLDGSGPDVNDMIRGKGSFDVCTDGIKRAVSMGYATSSIFTAHRMNLHDLPNMPELLASLGVRRFFIQVIGIRGNPASSGETSLQLGRQEWEDVVPEVAVKAAALGMHVTYPKVFLGADEEFECAGMVADNYFVFPNGRVYTCPLCEDFPLHTLVVNDDRLEKRPPVTESDLYTLSIDEGCVMNRILHPGNIEYGDDGSPLYKIACCMLKEEIVPA
jgi:MoaA/NifB/PqqE/SkfB family radical SAM enzyme